MTDTPETPAPGPAPAPAPAPSPAAAPAAAAATAEKAGLFSIKQQQGYKAALTNTWDEIRPGSGKKFPFVKSAVAAGGVLAIGHGLLKSKTSDGEDRSALLRFAEVVIGGGMIAGAALAGRV